LKTLSVLAVLVALCACNKKIDIPAPVKTLQLSDFTSMLSSEKTYVVSEYYTNNQQLAVPDVNAEDTYTFDGKKNDGWVSSKQPCIEYHYNFRAYSSNDSLLFEWVDFHISPQTFTVEDYKTGEWFLLKQGDTYMRYRVLSNTSN
jgi:hypothetical protein